jgi:hypothetical protein
VLACHGCLHDLTAAQQGSKNKPRSGEDDGVAAGDLGWDAEHERGGGEDGGAAGDVEPDVGDGLENLEQTTPGVVSMTSGADSAWALWNLWMLGCCRW